MTTRRDFLKLAGAGAAGTLMMAGAPLLSNNFSMMAQLGGLSKFTEQLPIPPMIDARGGGMFPLTMAQGSHRFHQDLPLATTWGYGGASYLGPTFQAMRNVPVTVQAVNQLGVHPLDFAIDLSLHGTVPTDLTQPRSSLHLHGGNTAPTSDGHPEDTFMPGQTHPYFYNNNQEAANLWYHDHALGIPGSTYPPGWRAPTGFAISSIPGSRTILSACRPESMRSRSWFRTRYSMWTDSSDTH